MFVAASKYLKLDDEDLRALENLIQERPEAGRVIPGTGGMRKIRFAPPSWNRGKSGATRVCYACFLKGTLVYLMAAFGKNEQENLSAGDKAYYASLLKVISKRVEAEAKP